MYYLKYVFAISLPSLAKYSNVLGIDQLTHALYLPIYLSRARIPVASQVTALEIWLLACILLVFGALAEYAFILRQVINLTRQQRRLRQKLQNEGALSSFSSPPAVFAPGASLTSNSVGGGRNGGPSRDQVFGREEWPMRYMEGYSGGTPEEPRRSNPHVHHQHQHAQPNAPQQVSLETHQTDRGANTTIAATTHHLHEMEVSFVTLDT